MFSKELGARSQHPLGLGFGVTNNQTSPIGCKRLPYLLVIDDVLKSEFVDCKLNSYWDLKGFVSVLRAKQKQRYDIGQQ